MEVIISFRQDSCKCLEILSFDDLKECERELGLNSYITFEKLIDYKNRFS